MTYKIPPIYLDYYIPRADKIAWFTMALPVAYRLAQRIDFAFTGDPLGDNDWEAWSRVFKQWGKQALESK